MLTIEQVKAHIFKSKLAKLSDIHGIDQLKIDKPQKNLGITLPIVYKEFLLVMGGKIGDLFDDVVFSILR
jgi:hypothetical protein